MEEDTKSEPKLMGRDLSTMPCFRETFLYSICSGIGAGLLHFLATSNTRRSGHVSMATYGCVTLTYWFYCRYNYSKEKFNVAKLQAAMRKAAVYKGTEAEKDLFKEA